jgi:hypothetical protein
MPQQPTAKDAHALYNARFNNHRYKVLRDIVEAAVKETIVDIHQVYATTENMNLVIDACMYACEHPHYDIGTLMRMASQLSTYNMTTLGESVTDYLRSFNPETAKMFAITLQTYQKAYNAKNDLTDWCLDTAALPDWQGNVVYRLLAASAELLNAALIMMQSKSDEYHLQVPYAGEKFETALLDLTMAQEEMRDTSFSSRFIHNRFLTYRIEKVPAPTEAD